MLSASIPTRHVRRANARHYSAAMKRNGVLIGAGVLGIIRGSIGTLGGLGSIGLIGEIEPLYPGYGVIVAFEFALAVTLVIVSIYAIAKANDPSSAPTIRGWGIAIIGAGIADTVWGFALFGSTAETASAAFGSLAALGVIGALFIIGARLLQTRV